MNRMISGMLELVRMERKTDRYAREPFNLSALTESVCEDMALICEKNIALTTDVEPDISITGRSDAHHATARQPHRKRLPLRPGKTAISSSRCTAQAAR